MIRSFPIVAFGLLCLGAPAGAQWVNEPGQAWADVSAFWHDTRETFDHEGDRKTIFADGHARTLSVFTTVSVGLIHGLDIWAQVPVHHLQFDDLASERTSTGVGDPRLFLRIGPALFGLDDVPLPVALRGGVKLAGGDFDVDAEIIPLGEGQRDWELMLELGRSFHPLPLWMGGWVGHRWREPNQVARRHPGDEWFGYLAVGGEAGRFTWQTSIEASRSGPWVIDGLRLETAEREMLQVSPRLGLPVPGGEIHAGIRFPLHGRNLPAGHSLVIGWFGQGSLW